YRPEQININSSKLNNDDRDVRNFNGIASAGPINVVVTLGTKESCRLEGDEEALSTIITEVKGNVLIIRPQTSITSWSRKYDGKKITAYITARELASLTMSGSGNMVVNGKISTGDLTTTISGSGSIKAVADVDHYNGVISGSGSLNITGTADRAKVVISSSGSFEGKSLSVNDLTTTISGSGTINIKAEQSIKAVISGSGSVNYSGNPTVEKTVIGSGRVRKI
ncbi:MAG: DUF2807 domain-containing protein, partial [Flavobacteriales bacterium]